MDEPKAVQGGFDVLLEELEMRYEYDSAGRIIGARNDGIPPRFVLGRSSEGCLWRFRVDLPSESLIAIARLAAREKGFPFVTNQSVRRPERLVMIERSLSQNGVCPDSRREGLTRDGVEVAELWIID